MFFYLLGNQRGEAILRLPSVLAGIGTVLIAASFSWRKDRLEALCALFLTSFSFLLVAFSSEARGYAPVVFFALAGFWFLRRSVPPVEMQASAHPVRDDLLFGACVILGLLSHLTIVFFYAGALIYSLARLRRDWRRMLRLHALPVLAILALYLIDLRRMEIGGGERETVPDVLARTIGHTLGLPLHAWLGIPYAVLSAGLLVLGIRALLRDRDRLWLFYIVTIVLAPLLLITVAHPVEVEPRYLIIPAAFFLLLCARPLAAALRAGGRTPLIAVALCAVFLAGNLWQSAGLLRYGRGGYRTALRYLAEHSEKPRIVLGLDHDFRTGTVLGYYAGSLPAGKELFFFPQGQWPPEGVDFIIAHSPRAPRPPAPLMRDAAGNRYEHAAEFPYSGTSGFYWEIYRKIPSVPAAR